MAPMELSSRFLEALADPLRSTLSEVSDLETILVGHFDSGRQRWPTVEVDPGAYAEHLAGLVAQADEPEALLRSIPGSDVFVAHACLSSDAEAIAQLESNHLSLLDPILARQGATDTLIADVKQQLRQQLFAESPPLIGRYGGRGALGGWLRGVAVRMLLTRFRQDGRRAARERGIEAIESAATSDSPELGFLKKAYRPAFKRALAAALQSLKPRDRALLALHYIDARDFTEIGAAYKVHRTTAMRWIDTAQAVVLQRTKQALVAELGIADTECDSLLELARTKLSLTISRVLAVDTDTDSRGDDEPGD